MPSPELPPETPNLDILIDTALRTGGETQRFDFKELLDLTTDEHKLRLVKAIGAFTNTDEGGFILVGIADDRRVVGLSPAIADAYDQTRVHAIAAQYLSPPPEFQVRHHEYQGHQLVVIEVSSFVTVPSVVRQSATFGKEKVTAGTFLFRSKAAVSGVLSAENDVRALCETLVKRRASAFLELVQRGAIGLSIGAPAVGLFTSDAEVRERADRVWPTSGEARPSIEVGFTPVRDLSLSPDQMRQLIPAASIPVQHGFPFWDVGAGDVHHPVSWGWYGRIPVADIEAQTPAPSYLWLLSRTGAFLYREHLWEEYERSVIPGGVGLYHLVGKAILAVLFLRSFANKLALDKGLTFRVSISANNVRGKYLADEHRGWPAPFLKKVADPIVSAHVELGLAEVNTRPHEVVVQLLDEMAWQFGRDDLRRQTLEEIVRRAPDLLGTEYRLE